MDFFKLSKIRRPVEQGFLTRRQGGADWTVHTSTAAHKRVLSGSVGASQVLSPSSTPVTMEAKLSSRRIMSAACLDTSEPAIPIATPMSAFFRAGESFTPSPVTATMAPYRRKRAAGKGPVGPSWRRGGRVSPRVTVPELRDHLSWEPRRDDNRDAPIREGYWKSRPREWHSGKPPSFLQRPHPGLFEGWDKERPLALPTASGDLDGCPRPALRPGDLCCYSRVHQTILSPRPVPTGACAPGLRAAGSCPHHRCSVWL